MAARASRGPLEAALAESLPEDFVDALVEHRVLERMTAELAKTGELDRLLDQALASPRTNELVDRIVQSDEMRRAIRDLASSPEVREAVAQQTVGLVEELLIEVRGSARRLDTRLDRRQASASPYAGFATRAIALTVDLLLVVGLFTLLSGFVALISSLVGTLRPAWLVGTLLGIGWGLVAGVYLAFFWSVAGRTPGMHLLHVRVRDGSGRHPSVPCAVVRALATWISIIPFFAGYLPVLFDARRRGLPDLLAGTEVVYSDRDG